MTTTTAPHVLATDRLPPMFRPGNQARLVPAMAANRNVTNSMLPGLGNVRCGNGLSDNGLAAAENDSVASWVVNRTQVARAKQAQAAQDQIRQQIAKVSARLQAASITGKALDPAIYQKLNRELAHLHASQLRTARAAAVSTAEAQRLHVQPWNQVPVVMSPATPDPLVDEPAGISYQRNQQHIMNVQRQITTVRPINPLQGLADIMPSTKTMVLLGVTAAGILLITRKKRRG